MARSMSLMALESKGVIWRVVLSGTEMLATCLRGVIAPKYSTCTDIEWVEWVRV